MRPIDVCTPKPFQLEHSCFVVSQRGCRLARRLATPHEDGPLSGSLAATVPVPANVHFARRARASEDERSRTPGSSGPPDANEAGENSVFTTELSLRRSVGAPGRRDSSSASTPGTDRLWHPCRLLHSSSFAVGSRFIERQALVWRPPRPVLREPRERRALCRPRIPSTDSRFARPARAETRTNPRSLLRSDGVHVMRIAAPRWNTPLLPSALPNACTFEEAPPVRLPFTRSCVPSWLSTSSAPVARFFEPEGVLPTSATRRGTGTYRERRLVLVLRGEVTASSPRLRPSPPPCGDGSS